MIPYNAIERCIISLCLEFKINLTNFSFLNLYSSREEICLSSLNCFRLNDIVVEGTSFELEEGDAVLYAGYDQKHWRPGMYKGEGMAQVFFHYVNQEGPYAHHAYDMVNKNE